MRLVDMPKKDVKKIESIELYSEPWGPTNELRNYYLKIVLSFDSEKGKGRIIIPKVMLPIGRCPSEWTVDTDRNSCEIYPCVTLDTGIGRFEILPGADDVVVKTEFDHRVMTKEEIEKELGYKIEIKGVCECPCKKKGDDNA